ncbi:hypothetical protein Ndes2437B_g02073 [Nannochloris sp. 'desiccata']
MSLTNGKSEAARPRIPKKRVLTAAEMRAKASYRAMERLLEHSIESEEQLWSIARVMSGEEFLAASEERCLAGLCGNALCSQAMPKIESKGNYQIDSLEKKVYATVEGPGYCCVDCAAASKGFAHRLGSGGQAMHRFERLMEQLREKKRKQKLLLEEESSAQQPASTTSEENPTEKQQITPPHAGPATAPVKKPKGVLKKKSDLAAGSVKVPIMAAEVKERDPTGNGAEPPKAPSAQKTHAVEGYVPKAALKQHRKERKEERRVRFSDAADDTSDNKTGKAALTNESCEINPSGDDWEEDQPEEDLKKEEKHQPKQEGSEQAVQPPINGQPAVFVLDVEDAEGPIEGAEHALSSKFGRLRVANGIDLEEVGLPVDTNSATQQQSITDYEVIIEPGSEATADIKDSCPDTTVTASAKEEEEPSIDKVLAQRLRQGASKYFPRLGATLPPELAQALDDSASEAASSDAGNESAAEDEDEEWMLSDTDTEDDDEYLENRENSGAGCSGGRFRSRPTLFGELVTNLDIWVTDVTVQLLQTGPGDASFLSSSKTPSSSVPEIETALSRFIAFALPPVMEKLAIGMPKGEVERNLMELIKTLQLVSALPAFMSSQWQLVVMMFLKALSMEHVPGLRPAFETREGVHRVNKILTANGFTIEEFVAVLEILLESD